MLERLGRGRVRVRVAIAATLCALTALGPMVVQSNAAPAPTPVAVATGLPIFSYAKTSSTPLAVGCHFPQVPHGQYHHGGQPLR